MHPASFETVVDYLSQRNSENFKMERGDKEDRNNNNRYSYNQDIGVAVMNIDGPLTYKPVTIMGFDCGGASYEQIKEDFTYLIDSGAKTIAFNVSSGGGEAFQMMSTASYMRKLATTNGVKLLTYVDGLSASAAYGLSVIADEIIMAPGAEVGSVGVVVRLINDSKALEMEGYERTYVFAGESKTPFAADGSFRAEFIEDIQSKVDALYEEFTGFVAEHRNLSVEAVRSTQAKTFLPKEAIELGLADSVRTLEDFYTYLADTAQRTEGNNVLKNKLFKMSTEEETLDMTQLAELQAQLAASQEQLAEFSSVKEALASLQTSFTSQASQLTEALEKVAQMESEKVEAKLSARKDKLAAVKQEGLLASLSVLDDASFEAVVNGFKAQAEVIDQSALMGEIGGQGAEVKPEKPEGADLTAAKLKAQFQKEGAK